MLYIVFYNCVGTKATISQVGFYCFCLLFLNKFKRLPEPLTLLRTPGTGPTRPRGEVSPERATWGGPTDCE